jgi:16S rRNA U516 pseudouridylate synthase RsuA-like enzyme
MELSDIANKSRSELLDIAYMLQGYASYIQDETNRNTVILNWCNSVLDELLVKFERTAAFDKYTKFDMKKVIMISDNSFAQTIEELRKTASMRVTLLEGKVFQVKKMSDIILEKSRL